MTDIGGMDILATERTPNRLINEKSPYLSQHMPIARWTGTPGARKLWSKPRRRISRCFSASAIRAAIGVMFIKHSKDTKMQFTFEKESCISVLACNIYSMYFCLALELLMSQINESL